MDRSTVVSRNIFYWNKGFRCRTIGPKCSRCEGKWMLPPVKSSIHTRFPSCLEFFPFYEHIMCTFAFSNIEACLWNTSVCTSFSLYLIRKGRLHPPRLASQSNTLCIILHIPYRKQISKVIAAAPMQHIPYMLQHCVWLHNITLLSSWGFADGSVLNVKACGVSV